MKNSGYLEAFDFIYLTGHIFVTSMAWIWSDRQLILFNIRRANPVGLQEDYHPLAKSPLSKHPFVQK